MTKIIWLDLKLILAVHDMQLAEHGGISGLREEELLKSALEKPKFLLHYQPDVDIASLAASYAFAISSSHTFFDGNKRVSAVAMMIFLKLNGFSITASQEEKYIIFMQLAASELSEAELAIWTRKNLMEL